MEEVIFSVKSRSLDLETSWPYKTKVKSNEFYRSKKTWPVRKGVLLRLVGVAGKQWSGCIQLFTWLCIDFANSLSLQSKPTPLPLQKMLRPSPTLSLHKNHPIVLPSPREFRKKNIPDSFLNLLLLINTRMSQAYTSKRCILIQVLSAPNAYTKSVNACIHYAKSFRYKWKVS